MLAIHLKQGFLCSRRHALTVPGVSYSCECVNCSESVISRHRTSISKFGDIFLCGRRRSNAYKSTSHIEYSDLPSSYTRPIAGTNGVSEMRSRGTGCVELRDFDKGDHVAL